MMPLVALGPDSTDRTAALRARMNAVAMAALAEAMRKPKRPPLCVVGDRIVEADGGGEDDGSLERIVAFSERNQPGASP